MGLHPEKLTSYFDGNNYIQHNPGIADGLDGLGAALAAMAQQGIEMKYDRLHKVLGKGNFVLTVSEGYLGGVHTSYYDLFRIENGKIAVLNGFADTCWMKIPDIGRCLFRTPCRSAGIFSVR